MSLWKTTNIKEYGNWMTEEKYTAGLLKTVTKKNDTMQYGPNPTSSCFLKHDAALLALGFNDSSISIYDINKVIINLICRTNLSII